MHERHAFEREIRALHPTASTGVERQVPPVGVAPQVTRVGSYEVRSNAGAALSFWALTTSPVVAAVPGHVVFDIVVEISDDPVRSSAIAAPALAQQIAGAPPNRRADLVADGATGVSARRVRFAFAAAPNDGTRFRGKVRLTLPTSATANVVIDLPIAGAGGTRVDDLFVFAVAHREAKQAYGFFRLRIVDAANPTRGARAGVVLAVVRGGTFKGKARQSVLDTDADGFVMRTGRTRIAIPTQWPFLVRAGAMGFVPRAHFVRLEAGSDNDAPALPPSLPFRRIADVSLANRRVLLDAGHGVVYNHEQRRSQEWFAAHKLVDEIIRQLTTLYRMPRQNIVLTRTAGFGLIEPGNVNRHAAADSANRPIFSDALFAFSLQQRQIRVTDSRRSLRELSDLLLVEHEGDANTARPVEAAARQRLLTGSATTVASIETRLNTTLAASKRRVRPGSIRWDVARGDYVYTREPTAGATGAATDEVLPITNRDLFTVDDAMLRVLADRSARWSLAREIGSGPPAAGSRPSFGEGARAAMRANGGTSYMRDKVLEYLAPGSPAEYFTSGIKAWSPGTRIDFMNAVHAAPARRCDLYLTVHLNAADGVAAKGTAALIDDASTTPGPIRMAKLFMKHVDPMANGLQRGGIVRGEGGMLNASNTARDSYVYFETEFMTSTTPRDPNRYNIADMMQEPYLSRVAEQIVAGIIETLDGPQSDLDTIRLSSAVKNAAGTVFW